MWHNSEMFSCVSSETNLETNLDLEKYMGMIWRQILQPAYVARSWVELVKHSVIWHRFSSPVYLLVLLLLFYFIFVKSVLLSACSYIGKCNLLDITSEFCMNISL